MLYGRMTYDKSLEGGETVGALLILYLTDNCPTVKLEIENSDRAVTTSTA
jgi:hypothetical protein